MWSPGRRPEVPEEVAGGQGVRERRRGGVSDRSPRKTRRKPRRGVGKGTETQRAAGPRLASVWYGLVSSGVTWGARPAAGAVMAPQGPRTGTLRAHRHAKEETRRQGGQCSALVQWHRAEGFSQAPPMDANPVYKSVAGSNLRRGTPYGLEHRKDRGGPVPPPAVTRAGAALGNGPPH